MTQAIITRIEVIDVGAEACFDDSSNQLVEPLHLYHNTFIYIVYALLKV
jgi:hypothetical protein